MNKRNNQKHSYRVFSFALLLSLVVHLFTINHLGHLLSRSKEPGAISQRKITVETISPEQIKKYRQVGIRTGKQKKSFSLPKKMGNLGNSNDLKLSQLAPEKKDTRLTKKYSHPIKKDLLDPAIIIKKKKLAKSLGQQQKIQKKLNYDLSPNGEIKQIMGKTGLNFVYEPVQGISEDELNTAEKIFFSFQKRTFEKYYYSFLSAYKKLRKSRPNLRKNLLSGGHFLTGRVIFDKEGNTVSIKILRSSDDDHVHQLFEETLKEIRKMPNPPQDFIKNRDEFAIYYQLHIKR